MKCRNGLFNLSWFGSVWFCFILWKGMARSGIEWNETEWDYRPYTQCTHSLEHIQISKAASKPINWFTLTGCLHFRTLISIRVFFASHIKCLFSQNKHKHFASQPLKCLWSVSLGWLSAATDADVVIFSFLFSAKLSICTYMHAHKHIVYALIFNNTRTYGFCWK